MALTDNIKDFFKRPLLGRRQAENWPFVAGKYHVLDDTAPVIVVLPNHEELADDLAAMSIRGLCMISPICRNASDVEKLIRNIESNLAVHGVVLAGGDGRDYPAMEALGAILSGAETSTEKAAALAHSVRGKLKTLDLAALQKRVKVDNQMGRGEVDKIVARINKLGSEGIRPNTGFIIQGGESDTGIERVIAAKNTAYELKKDKAGSFVIRTDKKSIVVEHHNLKNELLRVIEGVTARDLCITIIRNGWVSRLDHVAYLGRELTLAEMAIKQDLPYVQSPMRDIEQDETSPDTKKAQ